VIDFNVVSVLLPICLIGAYIGVFMNMMLPEGVLTIVLAILLTCLSLQSYFKARSLSVKERKNAESV